MPARTIILAGGSGFLGHALSSFLIKNNFTPIILTRGPDQPLTPTTPQHIHWDALTTNGHWPDSLNNAFALINLTGRTVNCRKTAANKKEILESRTLSTRALTEAWRSVPNPPQIWLQTSTAHIYGDTGDEILDESSPIGSGFAPDVGIAWEKSFTDANLPLRSLILRISFVIGDPKFPGAVLATLSGLTKCFLGGHTASGRHFISWIHIADLCQIILRALTDDSMSGIYVITSPNPVTNKEFMRELRKACHRPWSPPIPKFLIALGAFLMRTDPQLAIYGRRCMPTRLLKENFPFQFPTLPDALRDLLH